MTSASIRDRGLPRFQYSFRQRAALGRVFESRLALSILGQEPIPDLVKIVRQDPQPHIPLKA